MFRHRPINTLMLSALFLWASASCSTTAVVNLPAATSDFAGPLGQVIDRAMAVGFINNTPFRAIFTFGGYNPLDVDSLPTNFGQLRVEGNTAAAVQVQPCRKTFSVGGEELIRQLEENRRDPAIDIVDERALVVGVNFSSAPANDPLAAEPTEGKALGVNVLAGVDFTCAREDIRDTTGTGLLLFTFEQDAAAPGGFRIDFAFVPQ